MVHRSVKKSIILPGNAKKINVKPSKSAEAPSTFHESLRVIPYPSFTYKVQLESKPYKDIHTHKILKAYGTKKINVKPSKSAEAPSTFHESLRVTLLIGQALSLLPVSGLLAKDSASIKFVWTSWRCVYSFLSLLGQIFITIMCIYKVFSSNISLKEMAPIIFYGTTWITMVMFIQIAKTWPSLCQQIARSEELNPNYDRKLIYKCNITCVIVVVLALFEHILSLISAFANAMTCLPQKQLYEGFILHFYPWVFNFIPYSKALGVLTQYCMEIFWRNTREDYGRATSLVRRVDDVISGIIFISFTNNLFFICLQLFNTLEDGIKPTTECHISGLQGPLWGYESASYFLFSLVFLIARSVAVSLIASEVNTASTVPAPILYEVPTPAFSIEVQRFLNQVNGDNVALSGLQFFSVTRGLLLTVAGTIVTYELVMFQFNSPAQSNLISRERYGVASNITTVLAP